MLNRPVELWTTVNTLAGWVPQFENFFNFASKFCNAHKTRWGWDFSGSSNEAEINRFVAEISAFGEVLEVVRSGALAIQKGKEVLES